MSFREILKKAFSNLNASKEDFTLDYVDPLDTRENDYENYNNFIDIRTTNENMTWIRAIFKSTGLYANTYILNLKDRDLRDLIQIFGGEKTEGRDYIIFASPNEIINSLEESEFKKVYIGEREISDPIIKKGKGWHGESERHSKARKYGKADSFVLREDAVIDMYNCLQKQVKVHVDFVNDFLESHQDFRQDVTGLSSYTDQQLAEILALEEQIKKIGAPLTPELPGWQDHPMTPVASSFIKGAGAYKGKLLLEFHHDPGNIWGFDVQSNGHEFFNELMMAGSKGGWVWDKILGRPSEFGMAKGKFFAYPDENGKMIFYTTPGAKFVHKFGRPTLFKFNPVGYKGSETQYNIQSEAWKAWKESVVRPSESRQPAEMGLIEGKQRAENIEEIRELFRREQIARELKPLIEEQIRLKTFQDLQKAFQERANRKDTIKNLLEAQLTLTPVIDLTRLTNRD